MARRSGWLVGGGRGSRCFGVLRRCRSAGRTGARWLKAFAFLFDASPRWLMYRMEGFTDLKMMNL